MEIMVKKFGKMSSILEFSTPKSDDLEIFLKIWEEKIWLIFKTSLTNWGKNGDVNEKIWENEFALWILHIKVRLCRIFHENLVKM